MLHHKTWHILRVLQVNEVGSKLACLKDMLHIEVQDRGARALCWVKASNLVELKQKSLQLL